MDTSCHLLWAKTKKRSRWVAGRVCLALQELAALTPAAVPSRWPQSLWLHSLAGVWFQVLAILVGT